MKQQKIEIEKKMRQVNLNEMRGWLIKAGHKVWEDHKCKRCDSEMLICHYTSHDSKRTDISCLNCYPHDRLNLSSRSCVICKDLVEEEVWNPSSGYGSHSSRVMTFNHKDFDIYQERKGQWDKKGSKYNSWGDVYVCSECGQKSNFEKRWDTYVRQLAIKALKKEIEVKKDDIKFAKKKIKDLEKSITKFHEQLSEYEKKLEKEKKN